MYKRNQYINRLKKFSNKKLVEIATILGLEPMNVTAKTFVDRKNRFIIIWREDNNFSFQKNAINFSAITLKEFEAFDDFGKDLSVKYRKIMSKFFPKYSKDYSDFRTVETEKKYKAKSNKKVSKDENLF